MWLFFLLAFALLWLRTPSPPRFDSHLSEASKFNFPHSGDSMFILAVAMVSWKIWTRDSLVSHGNIYYHLSSLLFAPCSKTNTLCFQWKAIRKPFAVSVASARVRCERLCWTMESDLRQTPKHNSFEHSNKNEKLREKIEINTTSLLLGHDMMFDLFPFW